MQIFEFLFNPKNREDLTFDSFCYDPENIYERRMGSVYMVGYLRNVLPHNLYFLNNLARIIREKYYKTISSTPEKSLKETLKKTNEYLEKVAKSGDVSWLGNLNFSVLSLKNYELNFTKVGDLKILLARGGQLIDIDQKLKFEDIEPYPLKIFGNIISGRLNENDILMIMTRDIFNIFKEEEILAELAKISLASPVSEGLKKTKEILEFKKERLSQNSGVCLLVALTKEYFPKTKCEIFKRKTAVLFPANKVFAYPKNILKAANILNKISRPSIKMPGLPRLKFIKLPLIKLPKINLNKLYLNRKIILILSLVFILFVGSFIFQNQEKREIKKYQSSIQEIREKVAEAKTYLLLSETTPKTEEKANLLLTQSWEEILLVSSIAPQSLSQEITVLKEELLSELKKANRLVKIEDPELFFEFELREYVPQKLISFKNKLYFYSPYANNIFEVNGNKEKNMVPLSQKVNAAAVFGNSLLLFSQPNQLAHFEDGQIKEISNLKDLYSFQFSGLSSYQSNLYLWSKEKNQIIKYSKQNSQWSDPKVWLKDISLESMAVDGYLWILKNNQIQKYYAGNLQKTFSLNIFPELKRLSKIITSPNLPYIYLLEPSQKRIIVVGKTGELAKQYQSDSFENLLDFTITDDGKAMYLLDGLKVYKIEL